MMGCHWCVKINKDQYEDSKCFIGIQSKSDYKTGHFLIINFKYEYFYVSN